MKECGGMKGKILPICLLIIGLILLMSPVIKNEMIASLSKKSYEHLTIQTESQSTINQSQSIDAIDFVSEVDVLKAVVSGTRTMGIGLIVIPSVDLKLPIYRNTTNSNLLKGAGMLNETFQGFNKGNIILAGHHMKKAGLLFQPLMKLKEGESVYIMDQENVYQYKMEKSFVVNEQDDSVLTRPFSGVTLITCDVPTHTKKRLIFQGKLVKEVKKQELEELFY